MFKFKINVVSCVLILLFAGLQFACSGTNEADLVLRNGKIVTVDDNTPEVQTLAVKGDKIVAMGNEEDVQALIGSKTKVIDLNGKLAIPGFIEGHAHFMSIGYAKMNLNLMKVKNWEEIVAMVAEAAEKAEPGEWITGRGWHQEKWDRMPVPSVDDNPTHHRLSEVAPNNPVRLGHASGHGAIVNAKAMELAGITKDTPDPAGGEILRDADGNPTGVLRETAQGLISKARNQSDDQRSEEEIEAHRLKALRLAQEECLSKGVTSFQDAGTGFNTIDFFKRAVKDEELKLRLYVMVSGNNERLAENLAKYRTIGEGKNMLTVRAIKKLIDGALGSHGAWLLEPYTDLPTSTGLNTTSPESITETARLAALHDYQFCVHAIGDRGNQEVLNIFEDSYKNNPDKTDLRWRIEHSQHLHPSDIPRFGQLGVIASMQGVHCTSDAPWIPKRLGDKRAEEGAYVWQKLMASGAVVTNGTDAPVEDVDPIASYYATVSRKLKDGSVFYPDQRMSRLEALKSYTINCAYAAFEEEIKGSLIPGKLADITILSKDILTIPEDEIPSTEVLYTIVGGKVMYEKEM